MSPRDLPGATRPRLRPMAALLRRLRLAAAESDGAARRAAGHRDAAQLPVLRAGFPGPGRRRPETCRPVSRSSPPTCDLATGVLAMLALLTVRIRPLFWAFVVAFNAVGATDLVSTYYHGVQLGLATQAGQLGAAYAILILYVPLLMITHVAAFDLLLRPRAAQVAGWISPTGSAQSAAR